MRVEAIRSETVGDETELSALVGGFRVSYRITGGRAPSRRADPFVVAALIPAMAKGEAVEVVGDAAVSPGLVKNLESIQEILGCWCPPLKKVEVRAPRIVPDEPADGVASLFSGGVDSLYTALSRVDEITDLIFIGGFEVSASQGALISEVRQRNERFARAFGKRLVTIVTNLKDLCNLHRLDMLTLYHGSFLASHALAVGCGRTFIPASHTFSELMPWGSHPLVDPLWSTETRRFAHDGAALRRSQKLAFIANRPEALEVLRVCVGDNGAYNCGRCEKCLRTMTGLRLLGKRAAMLPPLTSVAPLRRLPISDASEETFVRDNQALALERGDAELADALGAMIRRNEARRLVWRADDVLLGGWVRRGSYRLKPRKNGRITAEPAGY